MCLRHKRTSRSQVTAATIAASVLWATAGYAACPQELAIYSEREKSASIEFRSAPAGAAVHTMEFRTVFSQNDVVLDGVVLWTQGTPRPVGLAMHQCPEGDVTGEELAACTIWQGVLYAIGSEGEVALLPGVGENAAEQILLPDFGPAVRESRIFGADGVSIVPWDVFHLSGCQE